MMPGRVPPARSGIAALLVLVCGGAACTSAGASDEPQTFTLTVAAGALDRRAVPVPFALPDSAGASEYRLRAPGGGLLPVQVGPDGTAWFVLDSLPAGSTRELILEPGAAAADSGVQLTRESGAVTFEVGARPVLTYHAEVTDPPRPGIDPVYARGGYVHPIHSPEGVVVTGDYPPDHLHHHGIWAAWTRTVFRGDSVDFWNVADRTGDVLPVALDSAWRGPVHGGFRARHRYVALTSGEPVDALHEQWTMRVYNVGEERPYWLFDLEVEQRTAGDDSLVLPEYRYGGVAFRGRDDWYGTPNADFLTSEGHGRESGNATRARWTHIGGLAEGGLRGVAVLSHPDNFQHPEPVRIHPREPYFVYAPSQLGGWAIAPGEPHRVRYRYVVYDGPPDPATLDRLWNDFARPPAVILEPR